MLLPDARHAGALAIDVGTGAGRATELQAGIGPDITGKATPGIRKPGMPLRETQAQANGKRVLQKGPADGRRRGSLLGQCRQGFQNTIEIAGQQRFGVANLTGENRIGDILACCTSVKLASGIFGQFCPQTLQQRNRQCTGECGFLRKFGRLDRNRGAQIDNFFGLEVLDQPFCSFSAGEFGFESQGVVKRSIIRECG